MIHLLSILLLAAGLGAARAQELDPAAVQVLAGPCANCHGPEGARPAPFPDRRPARRDCGQADAGLPRGCRSSATVMPRLMKGYDEDEIRALARWFAGIPK